MTITEEILECGDCNWAGTESEAVERNTDEDTDFLCPVCGEICATMAV